MWAFSPFSKIKKWILINWFKPQRNFAGVSAREGGGEINSPTQSMLAKKNSTREQTSLWSPNISSLRGKCWSGLHYLCKWPLPKRYLRIGNKVAGGTAGDGLMRTQRPVFSSLGVDTRRRCEIYLGEEEDWRLIPLQSTVSETSLTVNWVGLE